mmetsp:Transcript_4121/g.14763  ORF Transcript_4121/g.14763 Transcript_4121/m.14763 type:complete len:142 (+) Transcript_4121:679-1104(+)
MLQLDVIRGGEELIRKHGVPFLLVTHSASKLYKRSGVHVSELYESLQEVGYSLIDTKNQISGSRRLWLESVMVKVFDSVSQIRSLSIGADIPRNSTTVLAVRTSRLVQLGLTRGHAAPSSEHRGSSSSAGYHEAYRTAYDM